jgi:pseudouridine-5'-phosphate glycosidase/pseudouridine kinase
MRGLQTEGLDKGGIRTLPTVEHFPDGSTRNNHTAQYIAFNDAKKDLFMAMADMAILDDREYKITSESKDWEQVQSAKWTIIDANLDSEAIQTISRAAKERGSKVAYEPVSTHKSIRLFGTDRQQAKAPVAFPNHRIDLASPNKYELAAMYTAAKESGLLEQAGWWDAIDAMGIPSSGARDRFVHLTNANLTDEGIPVQAIQLLPFIPIILTKLGAAGLLHTELLMRDDPRLRDPDSAPYILSRTSIEDSTIGGVYMRLFAPPRVVEDVVSVNGVGDTFLGVLIAGLTMGSPLNERLINTAQRGAALTLKSTEAVSPQIRGILTSEI